MRPRPQAQLSARIQRAAAFYRKRDGFMGVVAVQCSHRLIYESSFGFANAAARMPFRPDTRFPIGSISKQFTAAAILMLQQDGKLKTSDPIGLYLPNSPLAWRGITLRNLLTHTSGIPDFDFGRIFRDSPHLPDELWKDTLNKPLAFRPARDLSTAT